MQSIAINLFMEELQCINNKERILLLHSNLLIHLPLSIFIIVNVMISGGYQPPVQPNQESTSSVGYRPPLFPGSSELAEVVPEQVEEEPVKAPVGSMNLSS